MHDWWPVHLQSATAVNECGRPLATFTWTLWLLCLLFFRRVQREPAFLRRLAAVLAPADSVVVVRFAWRGRPRSLVFTQSPAPPAPSAPPMIAEVRLSDAGSRMDVTQLLRQLRDGSPADLRPAEVSAYLSFATGLCLSGKGLQETHISPGAAGPTFRRLEVRL